MMNKDRVDEREREGGFSSWRSVGAVAAGLAVRVTVQRDEAAPLEEPRFIPVAWAAE